MGRYAHPALAEREEIMLMRHEGRSPADIARATGRDRSTHQQGDAQELVPGRRGTAATGHRPRNAPTRRAGSPACVPGSSTTRGSPGSSRG